MKLFIYIMLSMFATSAMAYTDGKYSCGGASFNLTTQVLPSGLRVPYIETSDGYRGFPVVSPEGNGAEMLTLSMGPAAISFRFVNDIFKCE